MAIRFDLQQRTVDGGVWKSVDAAASAAGSARGPRAAGFVYAKDVHRLRDGAEYRAVVRFRWYALRGRPRGPHAQDDPGCKQPDQRPTSSVAVDVRPPRAAPPLSRRAGATPGRTAAGPFAVTLAPMAHRAAHHGRRAGARCRRRPSSWPARPARGKPVRSPRRSTRATRSTSPEAGATAPSVEPLLRLPIDWVDMKTGIHPDYVESHVRCTCGNEFVTRSTQPEIHVEICSNCHPFYTGKQKLVDTGGRVERFKRRAAKRQRRRRSHPDHDAPSRPNGCRRRRSSRRRTRRSGARRSSRA